MDQLWLKIDNKKIGNIFRMDIFVNYDLGTGRYIIPKKYIDPCTSMELNKNGKESDEAVKK